MTAQESPEENGRRSEGSEQMAALRDKDRAEMYLVEADHWRQAWYRADDLLEKALVRIEKLERDAQRGGPFDPSVTGDFPPAPRGSG